VDRTSTLGQVWLGLTLGCAECHSHKYDPITQKEFYQLYAFFTGIKEPFVSGNHNLPLPPLLKLPQPEQTRALTYVKKELAGYQVCVTAALKSVDYIDRSILDAGKPFLSQKAWEDNAKANAMLPPDVKAALKAPAGSR